MCIISALLASLLYCTYRASAYRDFVLGTGALLVFSGRDTQWSSTRGASQFLRLEPLPPQRFPISSLVLEQCLETVELQG